MSTSTRRRSTTAAILVLATVLAAGAAGWLWTTSRPIDAERGVEVKLRLEGAREAVRLLRRPDGRHVYLVTGEDGQVATLTPDELAAALYDQQRRRDWLAVVFNITSPLGLAWVAVGLLGQLLFTGRMLVQWIHSERAGRSEVPPIFWWMSLGGAIMLLIYFAWRTDIVGLLGQSIGFVVYLRNLILIAAERREAAARLHGGPAEPDAPARAPSASEPAAP